MIFQQIRQAFLHGAEKPAFRCAQGTISYEQLGKATEAFRLQAQPLYGKGPIVIWGKKQCFFPAAILGCAFAGVCYLPVESSTPLLRLQSLLSEAKPCAVWAFDFFPCAAPCPVLNAAEVQAGNEFPPEVNFPGNSVLYQLYTSGSTGVPKGVAITRDNLNCFARWMQSWCKPTPTVIINQASFSFDLSVADFYQAFSTGACLVALESEVQQNFLNLFSVLGQSGAQLMVCTPSFASMLLSDKSFERAWMEELSAIFFCGETLHTETVRALWKRFPGIRIINAYGPTECTVAVTAAEILPEHLEKDSLPVGTVRPGTSVLICSQSSIGGHKKILPLPDGTEGEIVIQGEGVSPGYTNVKSAAFDVLDGAPAYFTGDRGFLKNNLLYFCGRADRQVKLHGFRVELDDVEMNLLALPQIAQGAVVAEKDDYGAVKRLRAFAVLHPDADCSAAAVRKKLSERLAAYMVPVVMLIDKMPLNQNGKIDRDALLDISRRGKEALR